MFHKFYALLIFLSVILNDLKAVLTQPAPEDPPSIKCRDSAAVFKAYISEGSSYKKCHILPEYTKRYVPVFSIMTKRPPGDAPGKFVFRPKFHEAIPNSFWSSYGGYNMVTNKRYDIDKRERWVDYVSQYVWYHVPFAFDYESHKEFKPDSNYFKQKLLDMDLHSKMQATLNKNRVLRETWGYYTVVTDNLEKDFDYYMRGFSLSPTRLSDSPVTHEGKSCWYFDCGAGSVCRGTSPKAVCISKCETDDNPCTREEICYHPDPYKDIECKKITTTLLPTTLPPTTLPPTTLPPTTANEEAEVAAFMATTTANEKSFPWYYLLPLAVIPIAIVAIRRRQSQAKAVEIEQKALAEQALENVQKEEDLESIKKEEEFQRNEEETAVEEATIAV